MMALVQIRERKERRQHYNLETLSVCNVKPSGGLGEPLQCMSGAVLHLPVQVIV